jgi:hypothetical protein
MRETSVRSGPIPLDGSSKGLGQVAITAQAKTSGGSLLADPDSGLIDGDPDMVQDAIHKKRDWFASAGIEVYGTDQLRKPVQHLLPSTTLANPPVSPG